MANHVSAEKRHRQSLKKQQNNRWWKSRVKTVTKAVVESASQKDAGIAKTALVEAMSEISKAKSAGVIHKNTAARKISRLSKAISSLIS